ncbi:cyanophycinase-like exopeptidase [Flavobacterium arsenatis]|uniref:Cyanophycinase-like exopeptidase n=1 Tax=Flavobacterium arsenatis TaxID=1484332 RepID=A0ABU1TJJ6_9FLAO|nr:T9SS type A sorting domain-containing protein [Flavobacterium arsenatis]MDR6966033.1 cyanophycinase-like exopeptidase [Flavobacterium arsenatis]
MKIKLLLLLFPLFSFSQGYTSYFTGNTNNITTTPEFGVCLMGGATEHDNAMIWLLQKANGGDVVVLRSSGSNGYNNYLYSDLGVNVNSVETLVITSVAGATNPYVLDKVANAEMIWFAGGDQWNYVSYFKNNALEDLLNDHINVKNAPIGGTSAGMAILGSHYFSAQNGSITSAQALSNPFHNNLTIGENDFLQVPFLENTMTDSHYDSPDRRGRHTAFLARMTQTINGRSFGIASNEYVAVCFGDDGKAIVFGDYPAYDEFAYFLQTNCDEVFPETMQNATPLTWNHNGKAVKVYKVPGTMNGTNYFNLGDWQTGSGGIWEDWSVNSGTFSSVAGMANACNLNVSDFESEKFSVAPVPFQQEINLKNAGKNNFSIYDIQGRIVLQNSFSDKIKIDTSNLQSGIYILKVISNGRTSSQKVIKN